MEEIRQIFLDEKHLAKRQDIIEQCTYMSFPCADYFHLSSMFMEDIGTLPTTPPSIHYQANTQKDVQFLGSLASEISYFKETLDIPLEHLLTLDKATL